MKRVIVIGASSGIGREVAKQLIADGWSVGLAARREESLQELAAQHAEASAAGRIHVAKIDVRDEEAPAQLQALIQRMGGMDLFFYAPGIGKVNKELEAETELATIRTNCLGFTRMVGEAFRFFASQGKGHLAAISSIAGTKGLGPAPAYSASKAMQACYLEALEQQAYIRKLNIRITDIRPGFVETALLGGDPYPMMLTPQQVAREIMKAIKGREHVRIIDWKYRILTPLWRCIPRCVWRHIPLLKET